MRMSSPTRFNQITRQLQTESESSVLCALRVSDIFNGHEHRSCVVEDGVQVLDGLDGLLDHLPIHADLLADVVPCLLQIVNLVHVQQTRQRTELLPNLHTGGNRTHREKNGVRTTRTHGKSTERRRSVGALCSYSMGDEVLNSMRAVW